ncbi:MAG: response regulator [Bdellovibrionales bacterium]|nr:response regulator [Bdellovibrionales bacterium]
MTSESKLKTVLIVDDDDSTLSLMTKIFEKKGVDCCQAHDGFEAKAEIDSGEHFDAVILDIFMPGMNGLELCEYIGHGMPVLFVSAAENQELPEIYLDLSDAILSKEDMREHLIDATLKAIDRWNWTSAQSPKAA